MMYVLVVKGDLLQHRVKERFLLYLYSPRSLERLRFSNSVTLLGNLIVNSTEITPTILSYLSTVSSNVQTQIDNINVALSLLGVANITSTTLSYLSTLTSNVQTQINTISTSLASLEVGQISLDSTISTNGITNSTNAITNNATLNQNSTCNITGALNVVGIPTFSATGTTPLPSVSTASDASLGIYWNVSRGIGETTFLNRAQGGAGGFSFYSSNVAYAPRFLTSIDAYGNITFSGSLISGVNQITATILSYLSTITSNVQTQLNTINTAITALQSTSTTTTTVTSGDILKVQDSVSSLYSVISNVNSLTSAVPFKAGSLTQIATVSGVKKKVYTFTVAHYYRRTISFTVPISISFSGTNTVPQINVPFAVTLSSITCAIYKDNDLLSSPSVTSILPITISYETTNGTSYVLGEQYVTSVTITFTPTYQSTAAVYMIYLTTNFETSNPFDVIFTTNYNISEFVNATSDCTCLSTLKSYVGTSYSETTYNSNTISSGSLEANELFTSAITTGTLASGTITTTGAITTSNDITCSNLACNSFTANTFSSTAFSARNINQQAIYTFKGTTTKIGSITSYNYTDYIGESYRFSYQTILWPSDCIGCKILFFYKSGSVFGGRDWYCHKCTLNDPYCIYGWNSDDSNFNFMSNITWNAEIGFTMYFPTYFASGQTSITWSISIVFQ